MGNFKFLFIFSLLFATTANANVFAEEQGYSDAKFGLCVDYENNGLAPADRWYYEIKKSAEISWLKPLQASSIHQNMELWNKQAFKLIIEDVRFSSYKCWDEHKNLTGFDIEMMTQALAAAGYQYVEFVPRVWESVSNPWPDQETEDRQYLSLLVDLINDMGDAVSAGMSIKPDRADIVHMIGPIYKAGKKLMTRNDNPKLNPEKLAQLQQIPGDSLDSYEALRGFSIMVQEGTIRADFFDRLSENKSGLVEFVSAEELQNNRSSAKLLVFKTDAATIESFEKSLMGKDLPLDHPVTDFVMIDTGSTNEYLKDGRLGVETSIVSGNLGQDSVLGQAFGTGDGVSFRKQDTENIEKFTAIMAELTRSGLIDSLVTKWFNDENAADHSWAN